MIIRKFVGSSMTDALNQVKNELGGDAVILQSRTFRPGDKNIQRFTQPLTEITAAVDYEPERRYSPPVSNISRAKAQSTGARKENSITPRMRENIEGILSHIKTGNIGIAQETATKESEEEYSSIATQEIPTAALSSNNANVLTDTEDGRHLSPLHHIAQQGNNPQEIAQSPIRRKAGPTSTENRRQTLMSPERANNNLDPTAPIDSLEKIIKALRATYPIKPCDQWERAQGFFKKQLEALHEKGASLELLNWLAEQAQSESPWPDDSVNLSYWLHSLLERRIQCQPHSFSKNENENPSGPFICALCGPTGVGKTTTLAKLAARRASEGQRVGMITLDTYRVAAVEQLSIYAKIMRIPIEIVHTKSELRAAIQSMNQLDCILIDTAGHSQRRLERLDEQMSILRQNHAHITLCLNLTSDSHVWQDVLEAYRSYGAVDVILTKEDETCVQMCVTNAAFMCQIPVAFITNGQKVPEDIHAANLNRIINL